MDDEIENEINPFEIKKSYQEKESEENTLEKMLQKKEIEVQIDENLFEEIDENPFEKMLKDKEKEDLKKF